MKSWKEFFQLKNLNRYLTGKEYVAGLSLTDSSFNFLLLDQTNPSKVLIQFQAEIEPGVIQNGELKKPEVLKTLLETCRHQPELKKIKNLFVILTLPTNLIYQKIFELPLLDPSALLSAINLNLQMLSPIKFEDAYVDWEIIEGLAKEDSLKTKIFSVFAKKELIDPYLEVFSQAKIFPLAVEFHGLSLWRLFENKKLLADSLKNYLLIFLSAEGLEFLVAKKTNLQFCYSKSWQEAIQISGLVGPEIAQGVLTKENFLKIFSEELSRVINFYLTHFGEPIQEIFLLTPAYYEELKNLIESQFSLKVSNPLPSLGFSPAFLISAGAALRGTISRVDDIGVSLMPVGTEEEYRQRRALIFFNFWTKVVATFFIIFSLAFLGTFLFTTALEKTLKEDLANLKLRLDREKLAQLEKQAKEFNENVSLALKTKEQVQDWAGFFELWQNLAESEGVGLRKLVISSLEAPVSFSGWTNTQERMVNFKDKLAEKTDYFKNVDIPLKSIIFQKNGVEFNLNFKIEKLP